MSPVLEQIYAPFYYPELTAPRRENRKIRHEIEILKAMNPLLMCRNFRSIEWHQKHTTKSRETVPFNINCRE
jgi:hypothetical protein